MAKMFPDAANHPQRERKEWLGPVLCDIPLDKTDVNKDGIRDPALKHKARWGTKVQFGVLYKTGKNKRFF
ncbi:hypothetical protein A6R68_10057 [Neotoma lepida]|uniref:Uncharacterized protein n=1 Tax=Neotoma lepida TaxID=56216 RepID=A0A1A6FZ65_NEOLE|nr:hypothetical protein A6R68_10057 [Neotoma lepida]